MEEGETPIHLDASRLTGRDVGAFCATYFLNPMAVKRALELRVQYAYFLK